MPGRAAQEQPHLGDLVRECLAGPQEMGTPAQRQLPVSGRSARKVSVAELLATPGPAAYPWYWPRTQC